MFAHIKAELTICRHHRKQKRAHTMINTLPCSHSHTCLGQTWLYMQSCHKNCSTVNHTNTKLTLLLLKYTQWIPIELFYPRHHNLHFNGRFMESSSFLRLAPILVTQTTVSKHRRKVKALIPCHHIQTLPTGLILSPSTVRLQRKGCLSAYCSSPMTVPLHVWKKVALNKISCCRNYLSCHSRETRCRWHSIGIATE